MKIVIYGLGEEALFAAKSVKKQHRIIGVTDSFAQIDTYGSYKYIRRQELKNIEYDYIVIALSNRAASELVKEQLIENYSVNQKAIIDFYELFTEQKVDKVLTACKENCQGIILGNSHPAHGINPQFLQGRWRNLAVGAQDIYYSYKVLEKCAVVYSKQIQDIEYVILDLHDYTIFNIDISLSRHVIDYWGMGGFVEDTHNYQYNENFGIDIDAEMRKRGFYLPVKDEQMKGIRDSLFDNEIVYQELHDIVANKPGLPLGYDDYPLARQCSWSMDSIPSLPGHLYYKNIMRKETIQENIFYFHQIIKLSRKINPKMKIILLLMPRYKMVEEYHKILLRDYKDEFEKEIKKVEDGEQVFYWNLKGLELISENPHFFMDPEHLNYSGGIAFTSMLNKYLKEFSV